MINEKRNSKCGALDVVNAGQSVDLHMRNRSGTDEFRP